MNTKTDFPRGSCWRKWDLHIHTPASFHWEGNKFSNMDKGEENKTLQEMIKTIDKSDVRVFAIVDYWTFDGYEKLKAYIKSQNHNTSKVIFPGMELRVEAPVNYRLNVQVILSDKLSKQQRSDFKSSLRIGSILRPFSDEALIELAEGLSADKASVHGFTKGYEKDKKQLLELGCKVAEITRESLIDAKKKIPKDSCLIVLPYDTSDGLKDLDWKKYPLADQYFMQSADIFETRKPKSIDLFLGRKTEKNEEFFDNFFKTMGGKPKPPISGSDPHKISEYGKFPNAKATWIKADPTFEGLRKILIEPEERVFIGIRPEKLQNMEDKPTKFIDLISIQKKPGSTLPENWFNNCHLPINSGLTAIIGNKGSGKSALGETIGLLGQTANVHDFSFLTRTRFRDPRNNKASHFEGTLTWRSGEKETTTLNLDPSSTPYELIKYIPQNYLETLCNELGEAEETKFDDELRSVIFSHVREDDRLAQTDLESLIEYRTSQVKETIKILQNELIKITEKIVSLENQSSIGYKIKIEDALGTKRHELEAHNKNKPANMAKPESSTKQEKKISNIIKKKKNESRNLDREITQIGNDLAEVKLNLSAVHSLLSKIKNFKRQADAFNNEIADSLEKLNLKKEDIFTLKFKKNSITEKRSAFLRKQEELEGKLDPSSKGSKIYMKQKITKEIKKLQDQLNASHKAYENHVEQETIWKQKRAGIIGSKRNGDSINYYKDQLSKLKLLPDELAAEREKAVKKAVEIFSEKEKIVEIYKELYAPVQAFIDSNYVAKNELQLKFNVEIPDIGFEDKFFLYVSQGVRGTYCGTEDGRKLLKELLSNSQLSTSDGVKVFVTKLIASLLTDERDGKTKTNVIDMIRKGQSVESLYNFIYGLDYLHPRYSLGVSRKSIHQISPGERGALLLVFYLLVDQNDVPLVIDQPEENLDNQTIYKLLVPSIKEAKKHRQIIIITHNPNLAVVCDAEQIIHCSIDKEDKNRLKHKSGAIENPEINKIIVDILEGTRPAFDNRNFKYLKDIDA